MICRNYDISCRSQIQKKLEVYIGYEWHIWYYQVVTFSTKEVKPHLYIQDICTTNLVAQVLYNVSRKGLKCINCLDTIASQTRLAKTSNAIFF